MTPVSRKALGILAYLVFLFVFVEVALQAFYYATAGDFLFRRVGVAIFAPDPHSGVFNRPGLELEHGTQEFSATYYTDEAGLRVSAPGARYVQDKPEGTYRVMLLGPSFAFGWGVDFEDTFAAILERELESRKFASARDIEVVNAGVPSMPAAPHLRWFEAVGRDYDPDLVVQFIYGSMVVPNRPQPDARVDDEGYLIPKDYRLGRRVRAQLKKFATVFYGWVLWTRLDSLLQEEQEADGGAVLGAGRELATAVDFDPRRDDVREALDFYEDLRRVVTEAGSDLLVVYFPLSYAIHRSDVSRWKHLGVHDVEAQIAFDRDFARHLSSLGLPTKDITGELAEAAADGERLYYWLDIHWTPAGNEVAARAIAEHLVETRSPRGEGVLR